ncbi:uncharacterized protein [Procambarus clarkii]|uniref:uncharacterized protein n=1 Tax=Procambarus clarkii TaxID=6728 RepID=UPI003743536E
MDSLRHWVCLGALLSPLAASEDLYRSNTYSGQLYVSTQTLPLLSNLMCALTCALHSCTMFSFQDGVCKMHDVGLDGGTSTSPYRSYSLYDASAPATTFDAAFNKPCQPHTQYATLVCERAFDGDLTTQFHSYDTLSPWLGVDLQGYYYVKTIIFMPNLSAANWFVNMKVFVGTQADTNGYTNQTLIATYPGPWDGQSSVVVITVTPPAAARYVILQSTNTYMSINDFKVMV